MKQNLLNFKFIILFLFFHGICVNTNAQNQTNAIDISLGWKFKTGDNIDWIQNNIDDSAWQSIKTDLNYESQGYPNYDGISFYRLRIKIPNSFKNENTNFELNVLKLSLGRIDDNDTTYFNGEKIGQTNGWDIDRNYFIPYNLIKWDSDNIITVRVEDNSGNGGLYKGHYAIESINSIQNLIKIQTQYALIKNVPLPDSIIHKSVNFNTVASIKKLSTQFQVKIIDNKSKNEIFSTIKNILFDNKKNPEIEYSFKPDKPGSYIARYFLFSNFLKDTITETELLTYSSGFQSQPINIKPIIKNSVEEKSIPFDLDKIKVTGYLGDRINANINERLLKIDEQGILEAFYNRPGKQTWVGEYVGKYLHAAARAWKNSGNAELKMQMDRIADVLMENQNNDGYLGTYLPKDYWTEWDVWAHKYDLLGLLSYYKVTGYKKALETSIKIGDLMCRTFGTNKGQINIESTGNHVGMASSSILEPMTDLYGFTGDKKYLDFCNYIILSYETKNGSKIISSLNSIGKVTQVGNAKAYEMMSNFTGIVKLYQITGETILLRAMEIAWKDIVNYRLYITGTASKGEYFQDDFVLPAEINDNMGEGCVSTTWLQFNQALYNLTGEAKYIDEIEKTIFNHLLAAENPQTGCVAYYTALQGKKNYRCTINGHCCLASLPRGVVAIPEVVYTKSASNGFMVNIYTSGSFEDNIKSSEGHLIPIKFKIKSDFPFNGQTTIEIKSNVVSEYNIALRVPIWCKNFNANVDGIDFKGISGEYLNLKKEWKKITKIEVSFDLNNQILDGGKSYPLYVAIKKGSQILAFDQSLNPQIKNIDQIKIKSDDLNSLVSKNAPSNWFDSKTYSITALYGDKPIKLILVPFAEAGQTGGEVRVWLKKK